MKKVLMLALSALIICTAAVTASAVELDESVEVNGFIGIDETGGPIDPEDIIAVSYPSSVEWAVTQASTSVVAASYDIENESTVNVDLEVTLTAFTRTSAASTVPATGLTLNLTGDLAQGTIGQNIGAGAYTNTTAYTSTLDHGETWTFSFGGAYTGSLPSVTPYEPVYDMVLNFAVAG